MRSFTVFSVCFTAILLVSCETPNGITIGSGGYAMLHFNRLELKYDFSEKYNTDYIQEDIDDFKSFHNLTAQTGYSGVITQLTDILPLGDILEESRKPSITVTLNYLDTIITKKYKREDLGPLDLYNLPARSDVYTGTVKVKSMKSFMHGMQVIWEKSASGPNWPISEFVVSGKIESSSTGITKSGTNNGQGCIAVRPIGNTLKVIPNTIDSSLSDRSYTTDTSPALSPILSNPIYSDGDISDNLRWEAPVIMKIEK